MQQLTQNYKSGEMAVQELSLPVVTKGEVLVRNHYSVISSGTEGSTVRTARKGLIGKAKEKPEQVRQVVETLKRIGPMQTYRAVMKRLDSYNPLGYSSAGVVIDVGAGVKEFRIGDKVACAGAGIANHAEVISVPVNLCVKLSSDADMRKASYNTLGAIAMQGIRQADLRLGESCAIIGLGLLGQLSGLLLRAAGVKTYGIDIDEYAVETAKKYCCDRAWLRSEGTITSEIEELTGAIGVDAVIITAGTSSLDPINFAGQIARKKGRVVVVGAVPTGFERKDYYRKELDVRMSCSYGPGRYDSNYEEKGIDYPVSYVRWTEKRNMEAFQDLVHNGKIDIDYLTTHEFELVDAPKAYDMIINRKESFLGVVLKYDTDKELDRKPIHINERKAAGDIRLAFIGAGSYAQSNLLPYIPKRREVSRKTVLTKSPTSSKRIAEKFGFESCTGNISDIIDNEQINTVFITTRHDSHAEYVLKALGAGKNVFVEKPLCLNEDELEEISKSYSNRPELELLTGFNRRFSSLSVSLKKKLNTGAVSMIYRINAGRISLDSWIQDAEVGGGRIIGEVCHFIDLLTFFSGSLPVRVYACAMSDSSHFSDTININIEFDNGSIGTISYFANGPKRLAKEYIEVYQSSNAGIIEDFRKLTFYDKGKPTVKKLVNQDKGQKEMVRAFIENIKDGGCPLISTEEIFTVSRATFAVIESLKTGQAVRL